MTSLTGVGGVEELGKVVEKEDIPMYSSDINNTCAVCTERLKFFENTISLLL